MTIFSRQAETDTADAGMHAQKRVQGSVFLLSCALACLAYAAQAPSPHDDPTPSSVAEFQATARRVLDETGTPGAGIALVRASEIEWEGGIGYADRDARIPVTAETHFRVGSISKTFVALALAQLYEDGEIDFESTVQELAPEIAIDNRWHATEPVRVIHLLQHTAGFDDMHFNEMYVPDGEPELPLAGVLARNPRSRVVRWPPGTRMSYSNPGYTVAGYLIEKISGVPYEDYLEREIFDPLEMTTSSFRLTQADEHLLARGYAGAAGVPVGFSRIYLRPSGNMHSSAREMGRFVRMLLNWGELGTAFVIDPEYLGNMEQPRTTLAARAGLRNGYGTGIVSFLTLPYPLLGHDGGIDGFLAQYAYSPARDVGFVILLNSTGAGSRSAIERLSSLAIRFLKRDVDPPIKPEAHLDVATLDRYVGYYEDVTPPNQIAWAVQSLFSGRTIVRDEKHLYAVPALGPRQRLIPVTETTFRLEPELDASRVFIEDPEIGTALATMMSMAVRRPRWQIEVVRVPVLAALLVIASVFGVAIIWVARLWRAQPRGFWLLKLALLSCPLVLLAPAAALALTEPREWGYRNGATMTVFAATLAIPVASTLVVVLGVAARRAGASATLTTYALVVGLAMAGIGLYLSSHDLLGLRMWIY